MRTVKPPSPAGAPPLLRRRPGGRADGSPRHRVRLPLPEAQRQQRRIPHADQRPRGADPAQRHVRDVGLRRQGELRRSLPRRRLRPRGRPAGALRLEAGRAGIYNLRFTYRRAEIFSALPDFANPLFPAVIPGQHTINRVRNLFDAEIELLPGRWITPILGYTRNTYTGPGRTTYTSGRTSSGSPPISTTSTRRSGRAWPSTSEPVTGRFVQGWRQFRETESLDARSRREEREQRRPRSRRPRSPHRL